jgi:hypothetical protein
MLELSVQNLDPGVKNWTKPHKDDLIFQSLKSEEIIYINAP